VLLRPYPAVAMLAYLVSKRVGSPRDDGAGLIESLCPMTYRFRLTFYHSRPGLFRFEEQRKSFSVSDDIELTVAARDAESLSEATRFHIEACGFPNEEAAWTAGEHLRLRLRVLNAILGLGISVPTKDSTSARLSPAVKEKVREKHGVVALDTIVGLAVFPDDDRYVEFVVAGQGQVYPGDPTYLFTALSKVWQIEMRLDERSRDALEILGHAMTEASPRSQFLLTYLAVERMVERTMRSEAAIQLIKQLQDQVRSAGLEAGEAHSLIGALAQLRERSFRSALLELGHRIKTDKKFCDKTLTEFMSYCIGARNKIAHNAAIPDDVDLNNVSDGLRKFCMMLIWTYNQIPNVEIHVPGSVVSIPTDRFTIRMM
jgi:hypothetical protein